VPEILGVLKASLGETTLLRRTPELYAWKHVDNPFGQSIQLVAELEDRIAGFRALMRWDLTTPGGEVVRCVRAVDTATHPNFQRRGVFRALTMSAVEMARDSGIDLIFNTPNDKSAPGYLSMGWVEVGDIGALVRPRFRPAVQARDSDVVDLHDAIPDVEEVPRIEPEQRPPRGLRTQRSDAYLDWRFKTHPYVRYGWVPDPSGNGGAVVRASVRHGRTETTIVDLLGGGSALAVRQVVANSRSRYVATWFSRGSPERKAAIRSGLLPVPGVRALRLVANPLAHLPIDPGDLGSWDFAVSDLELL
jgi:GNAT superfamily N-acetyltransferase